MIKPIPNGGKSSRYEYLDVLRGITIISMMIYHATWDLVYIAGCPWDWFRTQAAYLWQQSICWTFILLAGFCWSFGKRKLKRGCLVFGAGGLITIVTMIFTPQQRVVFGVLTLLGSSILLMIPLERVLKWVSSMPGILLAMVLFVLTRNLNEGYLGVGEAVWCKLPEAWYEGGSVMTYLGFMEKGFFSTDYFSLMPWFFLFVTGYFGYRLAVEKKLLENEVLKGIHCKPLSFIGRHSLLIYLLHQPMLYLLISCLK